eukprot:CAMPEP_0119120338 /NCGR_PEP_ID=MMETSP1310-20130426/1419_1 /TAXON_ID=464262 /ORGANISM="Genus nov. species nov., Strain RCC2339" /LENGTH=41 /DNA_ID= /DNA_START= /DNA_END= /DNA_ORIENTATION=
MAALAAPVGSPPYTPLRKAQALDLLHAVALVRAAQRLVREA